MQSIVAISIFDGGRGLPDPGEPLAPWFPRMGVDPVFVGLDSPEADSEAFYAHQLQPLRAGVLGCALAHRDASARLLDSDHGWAIVLEDDAILIDPGLVARRAEAMAETVDARTPVLLLFVWNRQFRFVARDPGPIPGTSRCQYTPMSSVAYLMSRGAAELVLRRQSPVSYTADWPFLASEVDILLDDARPVDIVDAPSLVDMHGHRDARMPPLWRLRILTLAWYLQYRRHFDSVPQYLEMVVRPRLQMTRRRLLRW